MKSVEFIKTAIIGKSGAAVVFLFFIFALNVFAQSTNQLFPTPITSNEISGTIKARDIGDSRLTTYFYAFNGEQGDIFINVVTGNFNGDIDVFTHDGAKTLTKIVVYADASDNETGRVIYLRKPEKLLLRIQGRTLNDEPATFRIKFAGSFQAIKDAVTTEEPALPEIKADTSSGVRVNSVGTIVEIIPKPTPTPKQVPAEAVAQAEKPEKKEIVTEISIETEDEKSVVAETNPEPVKTEETVAEKTPQNAPENVESEVKAEEKPVGEAKTVRTDKKARNKPLKENKAEKPIAETVSDSPKEAEKPAKSSAAKSKKPKAEKVVAPDPLQNVRLLVLFKDGSKIERPMSEILKFGVDKGILTVISKDGTIGRYSILDVLKMTIE